MKSPSEDHFHHVELTRQTSDHVCDDQRVHWMWMPYCLTNMMYTSLQVSIQESNSSTTACLSCAIDYITTLLQRWIQSNMTWLYHTFFVPREDPQREKPHLLRYVDYSFLFTLVSPSNSQEESSFISNSSDIACTFNAVRRYRRLHKQPHGYCHIQMALMRLSSC